MTPSQLKIPIKWLGQGPPKYPAYQSTLAAGVDLIAHLDAPQTLSPGHRILVPTGISIQLPPGYEAQIRPRSGLALRHGITVLNSPGTIDADYRGEIKIILIHHGDLPFELQPDERIAQMVIAPVVQARWISVSQLDESNRGSGGFGSTGQ